MELFEARSAELSESANIELSAPLETHNLPKPFFFSFASTFLFLIGAWEKREK